MHAVDVEGYLAVDTLNLPSILRTAKLSKFTTPGITFLDQSETGGSHRETCIPQRSIVTCQFN